MLAAIKKYAVSLVLVWTFATGLFLAWHDSATTDEGIHIASAYLALTRQEFRFDPEHPFLFKFATAVPLLALKPNLPAEDPELWAAGYPTTYDSWKESRSWTDHWFYTSGNDARLMIFLARIPAVICLVALCWLTWYLGNLWFSRRIGWFALIFTAFNPNLLAHGHLANTDVPVALAFLGVTWALWKYFKEPTIRSAVWLGLLLGVAQTVKFSAAVLIPTVIAWLIYCGVRTKTGKRTLGHAGLVALLMLAVIWIQYFMPLYLIQGTAFQMKGDPHLPTLLKIDDAAFQKFILIRYLLPIDYVKGLMMVLGGAAYGRPAYLLGTDHAAGIWYYFPVLFLLKTQVVGLALLAAGAVLAGIRTVKRPLQWSPITSLILLVTGVFIFASVTNKLNIGVRHIMPLLPFVSLAMAIVLDRLRGFRWGRLWTPALMATYCITPFAQFPNYIGYANAFVQPPEKAYEYFNDSNIDWGQQSRAIAELARKDFGGEPIYVNYQWSPYALDYYGATALPFDPKNPPAGGLIVVPATQLTWEDYAIFTKMEPVRIIGNHTFFFRMDR